MGSSEKVSFSISFTKKSIVWISATVAAILLGVGGLVVNNVLQENARQQKIREAQIALELRHKNLFEAKVILCGKKVGDSIQVDSDGMGMYLDGPSDDSWYTGLTVTDIMCVLDNLEIPSSVKSRMYGTTSMMGVQEATWQDLKASWSYHPSNGLDVSVSFAG